MRVILHIGTHKTGTTSIQEFCQGNRSHLASAGIDYPQTYLVPSRRYFGHHCLPWQLLGQGPDRRPWPDGLDDPLGDLRERVERDDAAAVLLSSENFCRLGSDGVERLRDALAGVRVDVMLYLRRQDLYLQSLYQTAVLHSGFEGDITSLAGSVELDYGPLVERWSDAFGADRLHLAAFEPAQLAGGDIVVDFHRRVAGLGLPQWPALEALARPAERFNQGYPLEYVEALRWLRQTAHDPGLEQAMQRLARALYSAPGYPLGFLSAADAQALCARHQASNDLIARERLGRDRLFLSSPEHAPKAAGGRGPLGADALRALLERACASLERTGSGTR